MRNVVSCIGETVRRVLRGEPQNNSEYHMYKELAKRTEPKGPVYEILPAEFVDPQKFVKALSALLYPAEGQLELDAPRQLSCRRSAMYAIRTSDRPVSVRRYMIMQVTEPTTGIHGVLGIDKTINLGHVTLEQGHHVIKDDHEIYYETVTLQTRKPLKLKSGATLPKCQINIRFEDDGSELTSHRSDTVYNTFRRSHGDLSGVVPDNLFLSKCFEAVKSA